ncbi:YraN family protein [Halorhodospira abdelmalekii]|uniref:YraN family protein n=1 Tax=Halorhodospira abdelmalekii TaxID=421629 RepID=UPI0019076854|nr:YraN family protein [Halorhodospira abdelmalekii]MBK1734105.1 YraN family protein [Halorhodospira abdelmalekii]
MARKGVGEERDGHAPVSGAPHAHALPGRAAAAATGAAGNANKGKGGKGSKAAAAGSKAAAAATDARRATHHKGLAAEKRARLHLEAHGLRTVCQRFRCRRGEIDLIMTEGNVTVFVEVRQRRSAAPISALESIGADKQRRLQLAASVWLSRHPGWARFDIVAIDGEAIQWIRNAFGAGSW